MFYKDQQKRRGGCAKAPRGTQHDGVYHREVFDGWETASDHTTGSDEGSEAGPGPNWLPGMEAGPGPSWVPGTGPWAGLGPRYRHPETGLVGRWGVDPRWMAAMATAVEADRAAAAEVTATAAAAANRTAAERAATAAAAAATAAAAEAEREAAAVREAQQTRRDAILAAAAAAEAEKAAAALREARQTRKAARKEAKRAAARAVMTVAAEAATAAQTWAEVTATQPVMTLVFCKRALVQWRAGARRRGRQLRHRMTTASLVVVEHDELATFVDYGVQVLAWWSGTVTKFRLSWCESLRLSLPPLKGWG